MTDTTQAASPPGGRADSTPFREKVLGVAGHVEYLPRGPRAELRRLDTDPNRIPPQVFWDLVEKYRIRKDEEDFWLGVLPLMVRHPQRFDVTPGRALARAGVSAARVERWLRLDQPAAVSEAGRLLSQLKGEGFDWTRFAPLLRFWTEDARRGFARDFFLSAEYRQRDSGDDS